MSHSSKDLLQELVKISSINPAFGSDCGTSQGESDLTDFLQHLCEKQGWPWLRQPVHPGRDNLIAFCEAPRASARPVLWEAHQDTVGTVGMTIDPLAASERDGRIWGRGACDVKGGMAAMISALARAAESNSLRQSILLAFTINEECGFTGATTMSRLWSGEPIDTDTTGPLDCATLQSLRPRAAVVAEPTELQIVVAHKGVVRWRCHTQGRAAHTSQPELGQNAIYAMAEVIRAVERYHREVLVQRAPHPLCGRPTSCVSTIAGGTGVNTVPDHVVIDIDRRMIPGESPEAAHRDLIEFIAANSDVGSVGIQHESPSNTCAGLTDDDNRLWAEEVVAAARVAGHASRLIGVPYGTNAWAYAGIGIPSVVFGPGSIDQAHTADEWIALDQLD